jgi:PAS domain S-box-containing protein
MRSKPSGSWLRTHHARALSERGNEVVTSSTPERRTQSALEPAYSALRERMRALLDAHPDMIFRVDGDGRILDFHAADTALLAAPPSVFLGQPLDTVFAPELASQARRLIAAALEANELQTWEYSLEVDGQTLHFESRLVPSGADEVLSIVRDITAQRRNAERARLTEARLNRAQEVAKIGSWERDLKTNVVWWSDETYRLLAHDPGTVQPSFQAFLARLAAEDRPRVIEALEESIAARKPYIAHHHIVLPDDTRKVLSSRAELIIDDAGHPARLVGTIQDVTERTELEREIVSLGERERERVGRDLHDGLGQTLTGILLSLRALANRAERGQDVPLEALRNLESHVQHAMNETRCATRLLSPRMGGLLPALEALVQQFDVGAMRCTLSSATEHGEHDNEVETHVYRIAQEAITNAVKHSNARHIELRYRCNGRTILLEVLDDGDGPSPTQNGIGNGLRNMRYRAHMINGRLDVERREGGGVRIVCSCPCR